MIVEQQQEEEEELLINNSYDQLEWNDYDDDPADPTSMPNHSSNRIGVDHGCCRDEGKGGIKSYLIAGLGTMLVVCALYPVFFFSRIVYVRSIASSRSIFSHPLLPSPLPIESNVTPFINSSIGEWSRTSSELDARFHQLGLVPSTLPCAWNDEDDDIYADLTVVDGAATRRRTRTFFALNLFDSELVIPSLARTIIDVANYLGPGSIHVSIFENGSRDRTVLALAHFAAALSALSIEHTILSDPAQTDWDRVDRIAQLAVYRNLALEPMRRSRNPEEFETVVFLNNVFACRRDVLELLRQKKLQSADAVCAMDWRATRPWLKWTGLDGIKFYDNWVSRTIQGEMLRPRVDILSELRDGRSELFDRPGEEPSRSLFALGAAVPVYSCWNGMVVLDAAALQDPEIKFRSAVPTSKECAASECKLLAKDFWTRNHTRWIIVPTVRVTYSLELYSHPHLVELSNRGSRRDTKAIRWSEIRRPLQVVCFGWARGLHLDLWKTMESPLRGLEA